MFNRVQQQFSRTGLMGLWLALILILAGCADSTVETEELPPTPILAPVVGEEGDTLNILYWQAPNILNPHLTATTKDWHASRITYEPLASFDKDGNLIPFLAAEIPSQENGGLAEDGKSVTWKLKPGVNWSDGEPFTAEDVRFTYEFITNPEVDSPSAGSYKNIESVEVIDDSTVKINFTDVNPAWSQPFVGVQGMIIPRHIFEPYNGTNAGEAPANIFPVGTGPYRAVAPGIKTQEVLFLGNELVDTNKIVFEPNPFFRESDKPYFSRVELKGGGTVKEAARLVLQTGDVDYAWNLQVEPELLSELEATGVGHSVPTFGPFVERIYLNLTDPNRVTASGERSSLENPHPFFSDPNVRQAFAYAVDRDKVAELYGPSGRPTSNVLVSPEQFNSPNTSFEFNLDEAAALLDEAGWIDSDGDGIRDKDGDKMKLVFQTTVNPLRQATQQIVKEALEAIGVEVELKLIDASIFFGDSANPSDYRRFSADMQEYNDGNRNPDPGSYMAWWTCNEIPQKVNGWSGENVQRWCNKTYDTLYAQSTTELDPEKRRQLFIQMNDLIVGEVVLIPLVNRGITAGVSNALAGIDPTPWDADTWNIKDWKRKSP